ncbi:MAG: hypothetical protein F6K30_31310 [Cyanothece sp. SIO2G6]|nr:hypothetical protein [Cyanothece sp. SIO2G6]
MSGEEYEAILKLRLTGINMTESDQTVVEGWVVDGLVVYRLDQWKERNTMGDRPNPRFTLQASIIIHIY